MNRKRLRRKHFSRGSLDNTVVEADPLSEGRRLLASGQVEEAIRVLVALRIVEPENIACWRLLSNTYRRSHRFSAALACAHQAVRIDETDAQSIHLLAMAYSDLDQHQQALSAGKALLKLHPGTESDLLVADLLREAGHFQEAIGLYRQLANSNPSDWRLRYGLGLLELQVGDYVKGWEHIDARYDDPEGPWPRLSGKRWDGRPSNGSELLVIDEHGLGASMMMSRFLPPVADMMGRVTVACRPVLQQLYRSLGVNVIMPDEASKFRCDYWTGVMSLGGLLEPDPSDWPMPVPYSIPDSARKKFRFIGQIAGVRPKVAVAWSGSPNYRTNFKRSCSPDHFHRLGWAMPDLQFFSFQYGPAANDLDRFGAGSIAPVAQLFRGMEDTAAGLHQVDLLVMTDSAYVHLAGTLGIPTLVLLPKVAYWAYGDLPHQCPIYRSVQMVRQPVAGDWDSVFSQLPDLIRKLLPT